MVDYRKNFKITKISRFLLTKQTLRNMNQLRVSRVRTEKSSAYPGGTETIVRNRFSYQVPALVGTNDSTNEKHNLYNSTVQAISRGGGD